jgi:hypothetical protein
MFKRFVNWPYAPALLMGVAFVLLQVNLAIQLATR